MCLIIHKQKDATIPNWLLESASEINPDGFGIAWRDNASGKFHFFKKVCSTWHDQLETASLLLKHIGDETEAIIHFRMRTQGEISERNCHPMRIRSKYGYWLFFHNGHFRGFGNDKISDTLEFAEVILSPLLKEYKTLTPQLKKTMEIIFSSNRIILVSPFGEVFRFPENWHKLREIYLSNLYAWRQPIEKRRSWDVLCKVDYRLIRRHKHRVL